MATNSDLQKSIDAKTKEVKEKFDSFTNAKTNYVSAKADWQSAVSDLEDLKRQQKALA